MIWKDLTTAFVQIFTAADPWVVGAKRMVAGDFDRLLWELDNRIASSVELRKRMADQVNAEWRKVWAVANETDLAWTPYGPDDEGKHLEWPLICHTRSGTHYEFESAAYFEGWVAGLTEGRNGYDELVFRQPPPGMTYGELSKLIGLAVSRGARVESTVPASRVDQPKKLTRFNYREESEIERAQARDLWCEVALCDERHYRPITTDERGVNFHKPPAVSWAFATQTPWALLFAGLIVGAHVSDVSAWAGLLVVGTYVMTWMLGAGERWGEDDD